jgi:hypothetical protein
VVEALRRNRDEGWPIPAPRTRAVIVASQVLFLDYDRARSGLVEEPEVEEQAVQAVTHPPQSKRSRRKQAA